MAEIQIEMRSAYIPHPRVHPPQGGPSLAKQAMAAECDINVIMAKYLKTGLIDHVNKYKGDYSNLLSEFDFHSASNAIIEARDAFDMLPSKIRSQFDNNPEKFLAFVDDPDNGDELIAMGLREPPEVLPELSPIPTPDEPELPPAEPPEAA